MDASPCPCPPASTSPSSRRVRVQGPKGQLEQAVSHDMADTQDDDMLTVTRPTDRGPTARCTA